MKKALNKASQLLDQQEVNIRENIQAEDSSILFYKNSVHKKDNAIVAMARDNKERFLMVVSSGNSGIVKDFEGEKLGDNLIVAKKCPLNAHNAEVIRKNFQWSAPISLRSKKTTVGCGDRLGLASPGHIIAAKEFGVSPVLAQQSMRELTLTNRTYRNVVDDTTFLVYQSAFKDGYGADGDHLKTIPDIDIALAAGMPMITLDLSDVMLAAAGSWSNAEVDKAFAKLPQTTITRITNTYCNKTFSLGKLNLKIDEATAKRCAVMYLKAMDFAAEVHEHLKAKRGKEFDLEISIDETSSPTLPEHHLFIANELLFRKIEFTSLAPRFIGEFQKAIDYIGDPEEFARQFAIHAEIAKACGCYKISVHSGSDKFMVYPTIGKLTGMRLHLKTAGTSWLEAVRVISEKDPVLYRAMHKSALDNLSEVIKLYHITSDMSKIPALESIYDENLPKLMEMNEARQLLHITYGPILKDPAIRPLFFAAMHTHEKYYYEKIKKHFEKHLSLLGLQQVK